jgi:hypothetical protein
MKRIALSLAAVTVIGLSAASSTKAQGFSFSIGNGGYGGAYGSYRSTYNAQPNFYNAQPSFGYGGYGGYNGPVYHAPSLHYDRVYHPTYSHWTPSRGFHTHGHTHIVPHYTPGHFDYQHGNHIHGNPAFHNH